MTKFERAAHEVAETFNPYGADSSYCYEAYVAQATKDIKAGYNDRMVGYYDKWYRYNRRDEGRAYDIGVKMALQMKSCKADFRLIEA